MKNHNMQQTDGLIENKIFSFFFIIIGDGGKYGKVENAENAETGFSAFSVFSAY